MHNTSSHLTPVAEHRRTVRDLLAGDVASEDVPLQVAAGRILAASLFAPEPLPSFDNSAMDGYAVRACDVATATSATPVALPVSADIPAGTAAGRLQPGTAHRIMTGAPVPTGADAIVEVEQTDGGTDTVQVFAARDAGSFVRRTGSDVAQGTELLSAGSLLGAAQVGVLAALGVAQVPCRQRPRVLICSTGSELTETPVPASGQIRDSNSVLLAVAVEQAGAIAVRRHWVADDVPAFLALLDTELADGTVDLVITSGGVSAGAFEVVKESLAPRGVEFLKVAMQPGMPQGAGRYAGVPVVCLPGNPVSTLTSFEVFVRPALRQRLGHPRPDRATATARLTEQVTHPKDKIQLRRGRWDRESGTVAPWGPPGSGFLGWFASADCLIEVPAGPDPLPAGAEVVVWDLLVD